MKYRYEITTDAQARESQDRLNELLEDGVNDSDPRIYELAHLAKSLSLYKSVEVGSVWQ